MKRTDVKKGPIQDKVAAALEPEAKAYRVPDGNGLYLYVRSSGAKSWEIRYKKPDGKYSWLGIGQYPDMKPKAAREEAQHARTLIEQGTTPRQHQKEREAKALASQSNTVAHLMDEWYEWKKKSVESITLSKLWSSLNKHIIPEMGNKPIDSIRPAYILALFRKLEKRGIHTLSAKLRRALVEAFDIAAHTERIQANPVRGTEKFIQSPTGNNYPHVKQEELPALVRCIDGYPHSPDVRNALLMMVLNGWRPGMVRSLRWADIDIDESTVTIPAERMKARRDYIAPLAPETIEVLKQQHERNGQYPFVFPNRNNSHQPMSDMAMNKALDRMGYKGKQSPHGFRHVLSTGLNERGYEHAHIEAQLAHMVHGVAGVYNKADYMKQRRPMMNAWANEIQAMLDNRENVVAINRA